MIERPHNEGWAGTRLTIRYYKDSYAYKADDTREETIVRPPKSGTGNVTHPASRVKQFAEVDPESIKANIFDFYKHIIKDPNDRFKSWEHCYEFFKANRRRKDANTLDHMSLHLAFYLASWGMLRGSAFLLQKDYRVSRPITDWVYILNFGFFGLKETNPPLYTRIKAVLIKHKATGKKYQLGKGKFFSDN